MWKGCKREKGIMKYVYLNLYVHKNYGYINEMYYTKWGQFSCTQFGIAKLGKASRVLRSETKSLAICGNDDENVSLPSTLAKLSDFLSPLAYKTKFWKADRISQITRTSPQWQWLKQQQPKIKIYVLLSSKAQHCVSFETISSEGWLVVQPKKSCMIKAT